MARFVRLLDALDPGCPRPSRGRPNRALDQAGRKLERDRFDLYPWEPIRDPELWDEPAAPPVLEEDT